VVDLLRVEAVGGGGALWEEIIVKHGNTLCC
jgi:hypothetical protein